MNVRWQPWIEEAVNDKDKATALRAFVRESNGIEGIFRTPSRKEVAAHLTLLAQPEIDVATLNNFVNVMQPGARLRDVVGLNVRIGSHYPPLGGPEIRHYLGKHLQEAAEIGASPYDLHLKYLTLHPYSDGNGRSSRALWLWMVGPKGLGLPFLQRFYYTTLSRADGRSELPNGF